MVAGAKYGFSLPDIPVGHIEIENNTWNVLANYEYRPVCFGQLNAGAWFTNALPDVKVNGNWVNFHASDVSSYAFQFGINASGECRNNTSINGYCACFLNGSGISAYGNKGYCKNALIAFGLRDSTVQHNTFVGVGATDSRSAVFGRWSLFGGALSQGNTSTTFGDTSVAIGGTPDLAAVTAALAAGWTVVAHSYSATDVVRWGYIQSVAGATINVDDWYDFAGASATNPTNGDRVWCVVWPSGNTVKDNIFDGDAALFGVNFDYVPPTLFDGVFDNNLYRPGDTHLSNLGAENVADAALANLVALQAKWTEWGLPTNDSHSLSGDPLFQSIDPANINFLKIVEASPAVSSASDGGNIGSDTTVFNQIPTITLTLTPPTSFLGQAAVLGFDLTDVESAELLVTVTSDVDGQVYSGNQPVGSRQISVIGLTLGQHILTVAVSDGTDSADDLWAHEVLPPQHRGSMMGIL
jgi:hypothetical protein